MRIHSIARGATVQQSPAKEFLPVKENPICLGIGMSDQFIVISVTCKHEVKLSENLSLFFNGLRTLDVRRLLESFFVDCSDFGQIMLEEF